MNTLFFYPQEKIINDFKNKKKIIFFDNIGFYTFIGKRKIIKNHNGFSLLKKIKILKKRKIKELLKSIRKWGPIYSRDFDKLQYHELHLRKLLGNLLYTIYILEKYNVKSCIMFTALPHHVKSLIFDLALRELNIKTVYLQNSNGIIYNNEDQAIPILNSKKFMKMKILGLNITKYDYKSSIDSYIEVIKKKYKKKESLFFKYPHVLKKVYSKNYIISSFFTFLYYFYDYLRNKIFRKFDSFIINNNYSIFSHLHMLNEHRKSINYYKKNKINFQNLKNKKYVLIASNYQPEASSYPMADDDYNHIDFISEIVSKIKDCSVIYKEHYDSFYYYLDLIRNTKVGAFRSVDYYEQVVKIGCNLLDEKTNINNKWFLRNTIPVTIGGSISIERSLMGYKSVSLGSPWYQGMPGVLSFDEFLKTKLNNKFFARDASIAKKSRLFLIKKLNFKCFPNDFGLGAIQTEKNYKNLRNHSILKIISFLNNMN
jgi:hypothetical protein